MVRRRSPGRVSRDRRSRHGLSLSALLDAEDQPRAVAARHRAAARTVSTEPVARQLPTPVRDPADLALVPQLGARSRDPDGGDDRLREPRRLRVREAPVPWSRRPVLADAVGRDDPGVPDVSAALPADARAGLV